MRIRIDRGRRAMIFKTGSKGAKRSNAPRRLEMEQNDIILDIARKQGNFCVSKCDLYYLLGHKHEIRLLFRNWGTSLKFRPSHSPLSGLAVDDHPNFRRHLYRNHPLSKAKVKTGRQVIRPVECFKNTTSFFVMVLRL